jgi:hypothetical protein
VLVTAGADAGVLAALRSAIAAVEASAEVIAPSVGGIDATCGTGTGSAPRSPSRASGPQDSMAHVTLRLFAVRRALLGS